MSTYRCQRKPWHAARRWSGLWNAATATIHRISLCNGFALELNAIHSGNCNLTMFFAKLPFWSVTFLSHNLSIHNSFFWVFRSSLSPDRGPASWLLRWTYTLRIWWSALLLFSYWFLASCFFRPKLNLFSSEVSQLELHSAPTTDWQHWDLLQSSLIMWHVRLGPVGIWEKLSQNNQRSFVSSITASMTQLRNMQDRRAVFVIQSQAPEDHSCCFLFTFDNARKTNPNSFGCWDVPWINMNFTILPAPCDS